MFGDDFPGIGSRERARVLCRRVVTSAAVTIERLCVRCEKSKNLEEFSKNHKRSDGYSSWCKKCQAAYYRKWRIKQRTRLNAKSSKYYLENKNKCRRVNLLYKALHRGRLVDAETGRRINKTPEEVAALRASHSGLCDICKTGDPGGKRKKMCLDHCHRTGVVRGFLCNSCNRALGLLKDSPETLQSAVQYLKKVLSCS